MVGAIKIGQKWRDICKSHSTEHGSRRFCHCANCELMKYCKSSPVNMTDEDITKFVRKINEVNIDD